METCLRSPDDALLTSSDQSRDKQASRKHPVHWTVLPHAGDPIALLHAAVAGTDFSVASATPTSRVIDVPRAIMKNRWASTITGSLSRREGSTDIEWTIDGLGNKHYEKW